MAENLTSYEVTLCIVFLLERLQARWLMIWFWSWDLHEKHRRAHCLCVIGFQVCNAVLVSQSSLLLDCVLWYIDEGRGSMSFACVPYIDTYFSHLDGSGIQNGFSLCCVIGCWEAITPASAHCMLMIAHMLSYVPYSRKSNSDWRDLPPRTEWCFLSPWYFFPTEKWDFISSENLIEEIKWRVWMEAVFNPLPSTLRLFYLQSWPRVFGLVNFMRGQDSLIASWWRRHVRWTGMEVSRKFWGEITCF